MAVLLSIPVYSSERNEFLSDDGKKFWSLGVSLGTSFATPLLIVGLNATVAPLPYFFLDLGVEFGLINGMAGEEVKIRDVEYSSSYFYSRASFFLPFGNRSFDSYGMAVEGGGWYIGLGLGVMNAQYSFVQSVTERTVATVVTPTFDGATGFFIGHGRILFKVSYAARATMDMKNLIGVNHRFLLGITYRIY